MIAVTTCLLLQEVMVIISSIVCLGCCDVMQISCTCPSVWFGQVKYNLNYINKNKDLM